MAGPLSHIRVLDLSRVLAGPWASQNLADLGAEVIKVERPGQGDDSRAFGPPWLKDEHGRDTRDAAYFAPPTAARNRSRSTSPKPEGQAIARELASTADVLLENYKFGDLARYGLGYEEYAAQSAHRLLLGDRIRPGPARTANAPGYDFMIQGMGGLMSITGERDDMPGGGPQRAGVPIADIITGMYATIAICAALAHRDETGKGQHLDLALLDSQVAFLANQNMQLLRDRRAARAHRQRAPEHRAVPAFRVRRRRASSPCGNDNLFRKFCEVAGCAGSGRATRASPRTPKRVREPRRADRALLARVHARSAAARMA